MGLTYLSITDSDKRRRRVGSEIGWRALDARCTTVREADTTPSNNLKERARVCGRRNGNKKKKKKQGGYYQPCRDLFKVLSFGIESV